MAYKMYGGRAAVITFLILKALFKSGLGSCPDQPSEQSGQISYSGPSSSETCRWMIPDHPRKDFALILTLRTIRMQYPYNTQKRCSGYLTLPGAGRFCNKPVGSCFIYGLKYRCSAEKMASMMNKTGCREVSLFLGNEIERRIYLHSYRGYQKSFTIDYNYVQCSSEVAEKEPTPSTVMKPEMTTSNTTITSPSHDSGNDGTLLLKGRSPIEKQESSDSADTGSGLMAAIVTLAVLLILSLLVILWIHRRNRKLEDRYEQQSRIRYSLSNPVKDRELATTAREADHTGYNARNHLTPLHGEVINNAAGPYAEIGARNEQLQGNTSNEIVYSSVPNASSAYSNVPNARSQPQDCVYAVVNKSTRRK